MYFRKIQSHEIHEQGIIQLDSYSTPSFIWKVGLNCTGVELHHIFGNKFRLSFKNKTGPASVVGGICVKGNDAKNAILEFF